MVNLPDFGFTIHHSRFTNSETFMPLFDFNKTLSDSADALKSLSAFNPLTIRKKGTRAKAIFALALVCFLWGTTWLASKEGVKHIPDALQMAGIRQFLGGFFYVCFFLYKKVSLPKGKEWIPILVLCFLNFIMSNGLSTLALQYKISAGLGAIIGATLYTKKQAVNFNPYFGLGLQMVIGGITLYSFSSVTGRAIPLTEIPWQSWAAIGYLVVFGSLIAFICYLYALQNLPTEQASIYAYINPIVAVILGSIVFNEKITIYLTIGGIVTLLGVYLVNKAFKITAAEQPETEGV